MYNLIQIQDAIKGLPTNEVMKYVNGTNPNVPSYLALGELNRRKQLQDTAAEFYLIGHRRKTGKNCVGCRNCVVVSMVFAYVESVKPSFIS